MSYRAVCYLLAAYSIGGFAMSLVIMLGEHGPLWPWDGLLLLLGSILLAYSVNGLLGTKVTSFAALRGSIGMFAAFILAMYLSSVAVVSSFDIVFVVLAILIVCLLYWALESFLRDQLSGED